MPVAYRLRERKVLIEEGASDEQRRAAQDREGASWQRDEARIRDALRSAIDALGWTAGDERRLRYEASATEQEILRGALNIPADVDVPDIGEHVFGFFCTIENRDKLVAAIPAEAPTGEADPELPPAERFIDLTIPGRVPDEMARARLDDLKGRLNAHLPDNVRQYRARWEGDRISREHVDRLCEDVYEALAAVINAEIGQIEATPELEKEIEDHQRFGEERAGEVRRAFEPLGAIRNYVTSGDNHPLAVFVRRARASQP